MRANDTRLLCYQMDVAEYLPYLYGHLTQILNKLLLNLPLDNIQQILIATLTLEKLINLNNPLTKLPDHLDVPFFLGFFVIIFGDDGDKLVLLVVL